METQTSAQNQRPQSRSGRKSQPRSQSHPRSSQSKPRRSQSTKRPARAKNAADNYTVALAKEMIVRSKVDVRKPRHSKLRLIEAINKDIEEREQRAKLRRQRLVNKDGREG